MSDEQARELFNGFNLVVRTTTLSAPIRLPGLELAETGLDVPKKNQKLSYLDFPNMNRLFC